MKRAQLVDNFVRNLVTALSTNGGMNSATLAALLVFQLNPFKIKALWVHLKLKLPKVTLTRLDNPNVNNPHGSTPLARGEALTILVNCV
jgi:hypothetical protein